MQEPNGFEYIRIYIRFRGRCNLLIASICRNPWSCNEKVNKFDSFPNKIGKNHSRYFVFDDINDCENDWQSNTRNHDKDSTEHIFLEAVKGSYPKQKVEKPICVVKHNEITLLGLSPSISH